MAFQSVPNTAEIVITYTGHGQEFKNVIAAERGGGYLIQDLQELATAVDVAIAANWLPLQSNDYLYANTLVRGLEFINDKEVIDSTSSAVGIKDANALPDNVTLSIKKLSGLTGRSARGRLYWIGTHAGDIASNENVYKAAESTAIVAAVEAVRVAIDNTSWFPVIVSRFTGGAERSVGLTFAWLFTEAVNDDVDSQRRRLIN